MSDPVPVKLAIQIRWRDLDALGHVNNAVYLTYFELARLAYVRALLGADAPIDRRTLLPADFQFILAEVTCHYRSPAILGDQLAATIWVSQVGRKSFVFEYRINDEVTGRLVAEGCSTQVWFDYLAGGSRPVPAEIVARMEGLQGAPIPRA
jgi:acyl-CoA thioester hydrolase